LIPVIFGTGDTEKVSN